MEITSTPRWLDKALVLVLAGVEVYLPLAGMVDIDKERSRLAKELGAAARDIARAEELLGNVGFIAKALADAVGAERDRQVEEVVRLMADLPPVPLVRDEEQAKVLLGLSSGALGKLLRAVRKEQKGRREGHVGRGEPEVVEGTYRVLSPALDFLEDVGVVGVPLLVRDGDGKVERQFVRIWLEYG